MRVFKCKKCGKIIIIVKEGAASTICCREDMVELVANSVDAAKEKHVPVIVEENGIVTVTCGEVLHPMEDVHYIEFMIIETNKGYSIKYLNPKDEPICTFNMGGDEVLKAVYAYCNLHGLWISNK